MTASGTGVLARHTASPQLAGYVYQIQQALLRLFDLQEGETLGLEVLDDLHVEQHGTARELNQVKYHRDGRTVSLTDTSPELWKSLAIWAEAIADGSLDIGSMRRLVLVTRSAARPDSIAGMIARGERGEAIALRLLTGPRAEGAETSAAQDTVRRLPEGKLRELVDRLAVCTDEPDLIGTAEELRRRIRKSCFHEASLDTAAEKLCGWLWERIVAQVGSRCGVQITEAEFHGALCRIRDDLIQGALPLRYAESQPDAAELAGQAETCYIRQLNLVRAGADIKHRAVLAYFRATCERTEWLDRGEVLPAQLRRFDQALVDQWAPRYNSMCLHLSDCSDSDSLCNAGLKHYLDIECLHLPIEGRWLDHYLTRGSYQVLADGLGVGWHPQFRRLLAESDTTDQEV